MYVLYIYMFQASGYSRSTFDQIWYQANGTNVATVAQKNGFGEA